MTTDKTTELRGSSFSDHERVAAFYDARVENEEDLNAKSVLGGGPAYHHSGIVRQNEQAPRDDKEALAWLFRTEEALTDLVWHLVQGLCPRDPRRFLDAGCGEGATLARFQQLAKPREIETTGITLSPKQAGIAKRHVPGGTWLLGDMLAEPPIAPGSIDVMIAIESTEYLGAERLPAFMGKAATWLDRGGMLLVVAGSWINEPSKSADHLARVVGFDDHYLTKLSSTTQYREAAAAAKLAPLAELDLSPSTQHYWAIRSEHPALRNSKDGRVERLLAEALELKQGEFRAYAWRRP